MTSRHSDWVWQCPRRDLDSPILPLDKLGLQPVLGSVRPEGCVQLPQLGGFCDVICWTHLLCSHEGQRQNLGKPLVGVCPGGESRMG